jgi:hypothetical protein
MNMEQKDRKRPERQPKEWEKELKKIPREEREMIEESMRNIGTCPVCGMIMTHTQQYGYVCSIHGIPQPPLRR